jgi:hypothetical protein
MSPPTYVYRPLAVGLGLATFFVASIACAREPAFIFAKPGTGRAETQAQGQTCFDEARGVKPRNPSYTPPYTSNVYAASGAAFAVGIMQGIAEAKARGAYVTACMRGAGFAKVPLTSDEETRLKAAKVQAERDAFFDTLLAQDDLKARAAAALVPAVPQIKPATTEPYTVGGLRLLPATISVAPQGVAAKQSLLTVKAVHRKTATLTADFQFRSLLDTRAEAGAVFHQVSYAAVPKGGDSGDTKWCGPVRNNSIRGRVRQPYCIWATFDGYQAAVLYGAKDWLTGNGGPAAPLDTIKDATLSLNESPEDLIGPVDLSLDLVKLAKSGAQIEAIATRDGQKVEVWASFVKFENDTGVLPFWERRLVMTRSGDTVRATLVEGGDGRGWLDPVSVALAK